MLKYFKHKLRKTFTSDIWNIGIVKISTEKLLSNPNLNQYQITWLPRKNRLSFYADPFAIYRNNQYYCLFEEMHHITKVGFISCAVLDDNLNLVNQFPAFHSKKHLSYPALIEGNKGEIYAYPENYKEKSLTLYEISDLSSEWKKIAMLDEGRSIVDATIVYKEGLYWKFYTLRNKINPNDSPSANAMTHLYLSFSDSLTGNWTEHPANPIKSDISSARCAGRIFSFKGNLYRPAQNSTDTYGGSVKIFRIDKLTKEEYQEGLVSEIFPVKPYSKGLHTASLCIGDESLVFIDGKKNVINLLKPWYNLCRRVRRIIKL